VFEGSVCGVVFSFLDNLECWAFHYEELISRDRARLDIFRLRDEILEKSDNLSDPDVLA